MGLHYVNMALLGDGEVQAGQPEIILYEPTPSGGIRITGADYLVYADQWDPPAWHRDVARSVECGDPDRLCALCRLTDSC